METLVLEQHFPVVTVSKLFVQSGRVIMELATERSSTLVIMEIFPPGNEKIVKEYRENYRWMLEKKIRTSYKVQKVLWTRLPRPHMGWRLELQCFDTKSHVANCEFCTSKYCSVQLFWIRKSFGLHTEKS